MSSPALKIAIFTMIVTNFSAAPWPGPINLPKFPKKDPRGAFAEMKVYGADGSPVRTPVEDWSQARALIKSDASWAAWVNKRRAVVDDWMAKRHDRSDWIAGWGHNFVSPKDGTVITFTPDEPGEETLSSPSDPKIKLTPKLHDAWVYRFRFEHSNMIQEAAKLYRLTGDPKYAEWTARQLDFYANHLQDWKVHGNNPSRIFWQSLDEAVALTKWVDAARLLDKYVTPEHREMWIQKLFLPQAKMLQHGFQTIHNIACWHRAAVGCVALYSGDKGLLKEAVDGKNGIRNLVARGITSDYLWYEQSLGYNGYVVRALTSFFRYALLTGNADNLRDIMPAVGDLPLAPFYLRFPDGELPSPADGSRSARVPNSVSDLAGNWTKASDNTAERKKNYPPLVEESYLFPTKVGLKIEEITGFKSWEQLLDPLPKVASVTLPEVTSRNLETSRSAIIRSGLWQVYFHYGQLARSHSQAEALNFEAFYGTVAITHDPGTTGYGAAITRDYFHEAVCHNVPVVDGWGQLGWGKEPAWHPGTLLSFAPAKVSASQPKYARDTVASRTLEIAGDQLLDTATVETKDGQSHVLGFVLNLQGNVNLPDSSKPDPAFQATHQAKGFSYWKNVTSFEAKDRAAVDVRYGSLTMRVEFRMPGAFTVYHATVPDVVPHHREAIYVETNGRSASLLTTFTPVSK